MSTSLFFARGVFGGVNLYDGNGYIPVSPVGEVTFPLNDSAYDVAFSPDDAYLAAAFGFVSPRVRVLDVNTLTPLPVFSSLPLSNAEGVRFNPSGTLLAVCGSSPYISLYRTSDWVKLANPASLPTAHTYALEFSPDGSTLAMASDPSPILTLYNTSTWAKLTTPAGLPTGVTGQSMAFSPSGGVLAIGLSAAPRLALYSTSGWVRMADPSGVIQGGVTALAFSADGSRLFVGTNANPYLYVYDTATWGQVAQPATLPVGAVTALSLGNDGNTLAVVGTNKVVFYAVDTLEVETELDVFSTYGAGAFSNTTYVPAVEAFWTQRIRAEEII